MHCTGCAVLCSVVLRVVCVVLVVSSCASEIWQFLRPVCSVRLIMAHHNTGFCQLLYIVDISTCPEQSVTYEWLLTKMYMHIWIQDIFYQVYQQDATLYNILYYCQRSTCFGRFLRPSSGAHYCTHSIWCMSSLLAATTSGSSKQA